jgi:glycerophosphoryl diester phosphodiesterase
MKKLYLIFIVLFSLCINSCSKQDEMIVPDAGPNSIIDQTHPLPPDSKLLMDGIYTVQNGSDYFGDQIMVKWNRTRVLMANGKGHYFILEAGHLDTVIFLQGYWRYGYGDETGLSNFTISRDEGGRYMMGGGGEGNVVIRGAYGEQKGIPDQPLVLKYQRPLYNGGNRNQYHILAHRGGGRTSDKLPHSENSLAMIGFTEQLGSTGIEIDVRTTSDGVPFLYHDADLNIRLCKKGPLAGPAENYSWAQLSGFVRLIHGEKIPTLQEALDFVLDSTLLSFIYLDMKGDNETMQKVIPMQLDILHRAEQKGRDLEVVIGIPNSDVLDYLMNYPDYQNVPSLCELSVEDVRTANSRYWAPRWTLGTQNDLVSQMHAEGRQAVTWTIDQPAWIEKYMKEGTFDGMLTNFPYVVAFYHFSQN